MLIQVTSDNIEVSPSMQDLAKQKVEKLAKYFENVPQDLQRVRVVLNKGAADETFEANVELSLSGNVFVGRSQAFSLEAAIIDATGDVERQYVKEKSKRDDKDWDAARELKRQPLDSTE